MKKTQVFIKQNGEILFTKNNLYLSQIKEIYKIIFKFSGNDLRLTEMTMDVSNPKLSANVSENRFKRRERVRKLGLHNRSKNCFNSDYTLQTNLFHYYLN